MRIGALEAGGTKMVCAISDEKGNILEQQSIPTLTPEETVPKLLAYYKDRGVDCLGIGCFGPVCVDEKKDNYGQILDTPKLAWRGYNLRKVMQEALQVPVALDTDVNGSLLGEVTWGAAKGLSDAVYITIGTGIGAGILVNGKIVHGMLHPELGHMPLRQDPRDTYKGKCPYHGTCFEGLAAGPSIEERYGMPAAKLADRMEVWELESAYIAEALLALIMIVSPKRIILGGGVMHQTQLFPLIRKKVSEGLGGYLHTAELEDLDSYIVPPMLSDDQGIRGAAKLAMDAYSSAGTTAKSVEESKKK